MHQSERPGQGSVVPNFVGPEPASNISKTLVRSFMKERIKLFHIGKVSLMVKKLCKSSQQNPVSWQIGVLKDEPM